MESFISNPWTVSIGSGLILFIAGAVFARIRSGRKRQTQEINIGSASYTKNANNNLAWDKSHKKILFVDDDTKFRIIDILKEAGWENTRIIKDVCNLDDQKVGAADILFIDIRDVGTKLFPSDEGLGLVLSLKKKYPEKKVVIYSSNPEGDMTHEALRVADGFLPKNADPYEFINLIENLVRKNQ